MAAAPLVLAVLVVTVGVAAAMAEGGKLWQGYYEQSCPRAEQIVKHYVERHIPHAPSVAATLIRTHFHDCFVRVRYALPFRAWGRRWQCHCARACLF